MQLTLLAHALDIAQGLLAKKGRALPSHLYIQADNTSREMRNQYCLLWGATLLAKRTFRSVSFGFLPVGHTHIDVDQRFSSIATYLGRVPVLETPEDFEQKKLCHTGSFPSRVVSPSEVVSS